MFDTNGSSAMEYREAITDIRSLGGVGDGIFDNSTILQSAFDKGFTHIYIPAGFWLLKRPIRVPASLKTGRTVRLFGTSNAYSLLVCGIPGGFSERGMIEYFATSEGFSWGIVLEHLLLKGNGSTCHGIYLKQIAYPLLRDLHIEGFDGAGLLLDKCHDGEFSNLNIGDCGRTSGNPNSLKDRLNTEKTIYSALHLTNTSAPNDANNMLRFNALQCEQNKTSPYISVKTGVGVGPIGIFFSQVHGEVRALSQHNLFEFFRAEDGDFNFDGMALNGFKTGFTFTGFGLSTFVNSRSLCGVRLIKSGITAGSYISTCSSTGDLYSVGVVPGFKVENSTVANVTLNFPGAANQRFINCDIGSVTITNSGGVSRGVNIMSCTLKSLTTDEWSTNGLFAFNVITGDLIGKGLKHRFIDNVVLGKTLVDRVNNSFVSDLSSLVSNNETRVASRPAALDPDPCALTPLGYQSAKYSQSEAQKLVSLVNSLQTLLKAEIARRQDLELRLRAAGLLET